MWSQGECLSKSYIKLKEVEQWKKETDFGNVPGVILGKISLPITVLALIGLTNTVTLYPWI